MVLLIRPQWDPGGADQLEDTAGLPRDDLVPPMAVHRVFRYLPCVVEPNGPLVMDCVFDLVVDRRGVTELPESDQGPAHERLDELLDELPQINVAPVFGGFEVLHWSIASDGANRNEQRVSLELRLTDRFWDDVTKPSETELDSGTRQALGLFAARHRLEHLAYWLGLGFALAEPGLLGLRATPVSSESSLSLERVLEFYAIDVAYARPEIREAPWPPVRSLRIGTVWEWLTALEGFPNTWSKDRVERALHSLGFILEPASSSISDIVWGMVGLESLFTSGSGATSQQLRSGIRALLGEPESFKKQVSAMYDFRSRFLHGDVDFPSRIAGSQWDDDYYKRLLTASNTATAVLVSALQELVGRRWRSLDFELVPQGDPL